MTLLLGLPGCRRSCEQLAQGRDAAATAEACEREFLQQHQPRAAYLAVRALRSLHRADEVKRTVEWLRGTRYQAALSYALGLQAWARADGEQAEQLFTEGLSQAQREGLHEEAARNAQQLASWQWTEGRFQAALDSLAIALREVRQCDDPILQGLVDGQLADLLEEVGDVDGAGRALARVARRFRTQFPGGYAQVRLRQGALESSRGNPQLAALAFRETIQLATDAGLDPVTRSAHVNLARLSIDAKDWPGATLELERAAALPATDPYEDTFLNFTRAQLAAAQAQWAQAHRLAARELEARPVADWRWQLEALDADALEQLGQRPEATAAYVRATASVDALQQQLGAPGLRSGLLAERRRPFEALLALKVTQGDGRGAVAVMERLLERDFVQAMATTLQPSPPEPEADAARAQAWLASAGAIDAFEHGSARPPLELALAQLGDTEVVAFVVARGSLFRAHLKGAHLHFELLESDTQLRAQLGSLSAAPDSAQAAEALGEALWPDETLGERVTLVLDAGLANVSFAGLRHGGRWLVEDHVFTYAPSLTAVAALRQRSSRGQGVWLLGDPGGTLPGAKAEARSLAARAPQATLALGAQASVQVFRQACHAELLHLAAHSGLGPEGAFVELADDRVTAARVLQLGCGPETVSLASCASAVSGRRDGAQALADAFLAAGSRAVLATTRSVDDGAAAAVVDEVFQTVPAADLPLALARAQRRLLATQPRSVWEPFVVHGL